MSETRQKFSPEVRERAVRLVREARDEHPSEWATICAIAAKLGCTAETLRKWVRQAERDGSKRAASATDDRQRLLERENRERRRALHGPPNRDPRCLERRGPLPASTRHAPSGAESPSGRPSYASSRFGRLVPVGKGAARWFSFRAMGLRTVGGCPPLTAKGPCAHDECAFSVEVVLLEFDRGAPKRATNLSFNSDLLRRAKALGINLSARLEPELIRIVADEEQRQLAQELAPSVAAWAAYYETHSAVVDEWSEE
jgi:transposase